MDFLNWVWRDTCEGGEKAAPHEAGLPEFMGRVLAGRGCRTQEEITAFLDCQYSLHDPFLLPDMAEAAERIHRAVEGEERILVFGDYDCDGVTATVMVYDYLENCGADVLYYIPEREEEGYGLSRNALDRIKEAGVSLVVTVDNGISALEEAVYAGQLGIDLIVTDHHQPKEELPRAAAVVNPHRKDSSYPCRDLCGAGVAFKLLCALEDGESDMLLEQYGDLLAVATLADVVPLTGENRLLARKGLHVLARTDRPGLLALAEAAGIALEAENAECVAFGIAPRINVAGRLGSVDSAVELLLCQEESRARELAQELCSLNTRRRELEEEILREIGEMVSASPQLVRQRVMILSGNGWHFGVIGIIASRMVDRFHKPCVILSRNGEEVRGSARSVEGFSMIEAVAVCGELLTKYGGHPMAAGMSLERSREEEFTRALEAYAAEQYPTMPLPVLKLDAPVKLREVTLENIRQLERMAPFGCENPQPVLVLEGVTLENVTPIGGGKHLRLSLSQEGQQGQAVLFGTTPESFPFQKGEQVDCAVMLSVNVYNEIARPSIRIVGMRPAGKDLEDHLRQRSAYEAFLRDEPLPCNCQPAFGREELSVVYRYLRSNSPCDLGSDGLWHCLRGKADMFQVLAAVDILKELALLEETRDHGVSRLRVLPADRKMDLMDSPTYRKIMNLKLVR